MIAPNETMLSYLAEQHKRISVTCGNIAAWAGSADSTVFGLNSLAGMHQWLEYNYPGMDGVARAILNDLRDAQSRVVIADNERSRKARQSALRRIARDRQHMAWSIYVLFRNMGSFEACSRCNGTGKHVNPAIDGHGISMQEFADDPDFAEEYISGAYDIPCDKCRGKRVVPA